MKTKVLFRHRSMEMGGVEKVIISTLKNLDPNIFDITLCVNLYQGELKDEVPKHVRYVKLTPGKESFSSFKPIYSFQLILRRIVLQILRYFPIIEHKLILKDTYDVEVAPTYADYNYVLKSSNKSSKKIGWLHSDLSHPKLASQKTKYHRQLNQFNHIIFGSQLTQKENVNYFNDHFPHGTVIYNAVDRNEVLKKSTAFTVEKNNEFTFVAVARLHFRKRIDYLLEAHRILLQKGLQHTIIVIGDGEERNTLEQKIQEYNLQNSFRLLGTLQNPYPYIEASDMYIMPSETESYPLILVEALLLEKPVITTDVGGNSEIVEHQKNGWLIDTSLESLIQQMEYVLTHPDEVQKIKENNKTAYQKFDNEKIFNQITELLKN